jgi:hypothetical protein
MTELSPAAQAVMIAATNSNFNVVNDPVYKQCIAAALRAIADQVTPPSGLPTKSTKERTLYIEGYKDARLKIREELFAIAAELEAQP